jgi:7-carboxy-7-deazaguanine synthase
MLSVTEIFASIQGESTHAGRNCVFVRLSGCNLRCVWCDTTYAFTPGTEMALGEIIAQVQSFQPVNLVEITGGEPLLQNDVYPLMERLLELGFEVLLETNGTLPLERVPAGVAKIMDVKCPDSGASFLLENLCCLNPSRDEVKFVLAGRADYEFARTFAEHYLPEGITVLFSSVPDRLSATTLAEWMIQDRLPYRLQLQLHKILWEPSRRGV